MSIATPLDEDAVLKAAVETGAIVTAEELGDAGGLGQPGGAGAVEASARSVGVSLS